MRVRKYNPIAAVAVTSFCMLVMLSACSNGSDVKSGSKPSSKHNSKNIKAQKSVSSATTLTKKVNDKKLKHAHPSNPCTEALEHSHLYQKEDHEHSYDCENTNEFIGNAHVHPATDKTRRFRHVHPNGANKHSHH